MGAIEVAEKEVAGGTGGKEGAERVVEANREALGKWLDKKVSTIMVPSIDDDYG